MMVTGDIKLVGDEYAGFYSCGLSMQDSESIHRFQTVSETERETVMKTADGLELRICHDRHPVTGATVISTTFYNGSDSEVTMEMLTSFRIPGIPADRIHRILSWWSAEGRLKTDRLTELNMERSWNHMAFRIEKFGNVGSQPVRKYFPFVAAEDSKSGRVTAVQLYSPASWQMEVTVRHDDTVTLAGGIADRDFGQWTKTIAPGDSFTAPKAVAAEGASLEEVCDRLVKTQTPDISPADRDMGIVFNEYCTTWGNPTLENLKKICDKIAGKGIRYLVMDSGWHGPEGYFWDTAGDWSVRKNRFPYGLRELTTYIRQKGMIPGIWFEFEVVCPKTERFGMTEHLLKKDGVPLTIGHRRFLDMEDPWVTERLTEDVIGTLRDNDFGYIKVDYNDTLGMGCDGPESMGENLRRKVHATQAFFRKMKQELPELVIENCSSGGHRLEPSMMELSSMASFSDAHEIPSLPLIAANLHRVIRPEQSQIWSVLRKEDTDERLYFSMCATLLGRMGLSGDIYDLSDHQWELVDAGIAFYKEAADIIRDGRTVVLKADTDSYKEPTGGQAVTRVLGNRALTVYHRFAESVDYNTFCRNHRIVVQDNAKEAGYGCADRDFSAEAWISEYTEHQE